MGEENHVNLLKEAKGYSRKYIIGTFDSFTQPLSPLYEYLGPSLRPRSPREVRAVQPVLCGGGSARIPLVQSGLQPGVPGPPEPARRGVCGPAVRAPPHGHVQADP